MPQNKPRPSILLKPVLGTVVAVALASGSAMSEPKLEPRVDAVEKAIILNYITDTVQSGQIVKLGQEVNALQASDTLQWGFIGALGAGHVQQAGQIGDLEKSDAKQDKALDKQAGQIGKLQAADDKHDAALDKAAEAIKTVAKQSAEAVEEAKAEAAEKIEAVEAVNDAQDKAITKNAARIGEAEKVNAKQDAEIDGLQKSDKRQDKKLSEHETRLTANEALDAAQDITLASHGAQLSTHNQLIGDLAAENKDQWAAINANSALLSDHSRKLGELAEGVAMAMSLPDTYLGDLENYSVAASCAAYDGKGACGMAFVARIDQSRWSVNVKGAMSDGGQAAGAVGVRYGW